MTAPVVRLRGMVVKMENTEQNWNRMAAAYEDFTAGADSYSYRIEWPCIERLLPDLHGKSVIDLGCGTGRFTFLLEEAGAAQTVGVDLSEEMLQLAKEQAEERHSKAKFLKGNIAKPFTKENFDFAFSSTSTHYLQNLKPFFENLHSLLRPEGECVLSVMHPVYTAQYPIGRGEQFPDDSEWTVRYLDKRERAYIQPWIEYNDKMENFLSRSWHHMFSDYVNAAVGSGFSILETQEPMPPAEWKESVPERYDGFLETPSYLILKLRRD